MPHLPYQLTTRRFCAGLTRSALAFLLLAEAALLVGLASVL